MITAIVLIHTERGQTLSAAEKLAGLPDVAEVYSVTGEYDLVAIVRVKNYDQMSELVPKRIVAVSGVASTHTLMAFQYYSRHDMERMWGLGMENEIRPG